MTVHSDVDGSVTWDSEGITAERVFIVEDVSSDAATKLYQAMLSNGIPFKGDPHPSIPGAIVTSVTATPQEGKVRVVANYGPQTTDESEPSEAPESAVLIVASSTTETTTNLDKDGQPIYGTITFSDGTTPAVQQLLEANILVPTLTIQFQRKERNCPIRKAIGYVGRVNDQAIGVFSAGTLLCTELEGTTNDGGQTYDVSYVFQHNPATWAAVLEYQDKDAGGAHADVNPATGNGLKVAQLYKEEDFGRLNLDFSFAKWPN